MSGGIRLTTVPKSRDDLRLVGQSILSEPYPRTSVSSQTILTSQRLEGVRVGLLSGDVVTGVAFHVQTASASLTVAKVGLYSAAGTLLASSADFSGTLNGATGLIQGAFSSTYAITSSADYVVALLNVGTTPATLYRSSNVSALVAGAGTIGHGWVSQTGQADLPASATFAAGNVAYWMCAY